MIKHGQFLDALAMRESTNNYAYVNPNNGAAGRYSILPKTWADWSHQFWGTPLDSPRDIMLPANQEQIATWRIVRWYLTLRTKFPAETTAQTFQRLCVCWRDSFPTAILDPTSWSDGTTFYVKKVGFWLTELGYEGW